MTRAAALLLALVAAGPVAGCVGVHDPMAEPLAGREATVRLRPGAPRVAVNWPVAFRRAAVFRVVNETGVDVESVEIDLTAPGAPRELVRASLLGREGVPVRLMYAPHGQFPLRAQVGGPGAVLLRPGEVAEIRLDVLGSPGAALVKFGVPGVTPE